MEQVKAYDPNQIMEELANGTLSLEKIAQMMSHIAMAIGMDKKEMEEIFQLFSTKEQTK